MMQIGRVGRRRFMRPYSSGVVRDTMLNRYLRDPVKMIVIPVTTERVFVYHKHTKDFLNDRSRLIKLEQWLITKAGTIWSKLNASPKSYNKKIVAGVNKLLMNTPWMENSLKTIPGDNYLLKRVHKKEGSEEGHGETKLTLKEYLSSKAPLQTKPLNVYYPGKVVAESSVTNELRALYQRGLQYHRKQALLCLLGLPLTIPVILVPIIPNVPGFYLTYRAYCNLKAYLGAKHLKTIMENGNPKLEFKDLECYDQLWAGTDASDCAEQKETLLLNEQNLAKIIELLDIPEMKLDLEKVIHQESARISGGRS